jgi:sugar phosphate isomerase/epimerase
LIESRFNRRRMCRLLATAPAAVALGALARGEESEKPFALRYVLSSSLYGKTRLEEILPEVKKTGASGIDLWPLRHADQREQVEAMGHERFGELLKKHGVGLALTTRFDLGPLKLRDEMHFVRRFGGEMIVTGFVPKAADAERFVEQLAPHVEVAEKQGITLAIENHGCSPDDIRHFAKLVKSPRLGVALAPYHLPQDPALLARLIEDLGSKLVLFYAWQHGNGCMKPMPVDEQLLQMPGRGPLDFRPILGALRKIDFQGPVEIFMHPVPRGVPIRESTLLVTKEINRARSYLSECLGQIRDPL